MPLIILIDKRSQMSNLAGFAHGLKMRRITNVDNKRFNMSVNIQIKSHSKNALSKRGRRYYLCKKREKRR